MRSSLLLALIGVILGGSPILSAAASEATPPQVLREIEPTFPSDPQRPGLDGVVVADIIVMANGRVAEAWPIAYTDRLFGSHAVDALLEWTFRPASQNGKKIPYMVQAPVIFHHGPKEPIWPFGEEMIRLQRAIDRFFRLAAGKMTGAAPAIDAEPRASDRLWFELSVTGNQIQAGLEVPSRDPEANQMLGYLQRYLVLRPPSSGFVSSVQSYKKITVSAPRLKFLRTAEADRVK
jgi:hypothetical protein